MIENKGLYLSCDPIDQPEGTWRNARNIVLSKVKGAIANEDGTIEVPITPIESVTTTPIGVTPFPDGSYVIYSAGTKDRIGVVNVDGTYVDIIVDTIFGFSTSFPIRSSEAEYNFLGQRIIAFTDGNQSPKILNIDDLPFSLNPDKSLVNPEDIVDAEVFSTFKTPIIDFDISSNSGSVPAGNYSVAIAYKNYDGTRTQNSIPIKNINIVDDSTSDGAEKFDGVVPGTLTNKSINFTITNVDTRYDKLVLIIISRVNNLITAQEVKEIDINSTTATISYIGTEQVAELELSEVITPRPLYIKTKAMAQAKGVLYHANLEAVEDIEYQEYANAIRIFYSTRLININNINVSHRFKLPAGFAHGGVYAFYIVFHLTNGSLSRAFHIPGLPSTSYTNSPKATSSIASAQGITALKYQIEDTTHGTGISYTYTTSSEGIKNVSNDSVGSNMGFWENTDEVYPSDFPALAGQKVRHHVFPTIKTCKTRHYNTNNNYGKTELDVLGIDVKNVVIPAEIAAKVEGWSIVYAKRDYVTSNTLGTDIFQFAAKIESNDDRIWSSGGNWSIDARQPDGDGSGGTWGNDIQLRRDYARGHNFELLKDKPQFGIGGLFLDFELKYVKSGLSQSYISKGIEGGNLVESGNMKGQNAGAVIDLRDTVNNVVTVPASQTVRRITEFRYYPNGIIDGNVSTMKNEETIHIGLNNGNTIPLDHDVVNINSESRTPNVLFQGSDNEETYLITYKQVKSNLYANYNQQLLVLTDTTVLKGSSGKQNIYGGDSFVSLRSYITSSARFGSDTGGEEGISIIRAHIAESRYNIGLRYEVPGNINTKYYPKTAPLEFWSRPTGFDQDGIEMIFSRRSNINEYGYSEDYNASNNLSQVVIYSPNQITTNKFPFRVIKGGRSGANSNSLNSWKTYLSADYYESNRNRGPIENIVTIDDILLIHHFYGLYRTLGSEKLSIGSTEVYLGTGDVFDQDPKEPLSTKLGYLGNQNIFSSFSFEGAYAWVDQSQGRIFTISKEGIQEISKQGMYEYLRDNTKINNTLPNSPITGFSIIGGYDPKYNRLLFTKKAGDDSFTLSYSLDFKCWVCYHDYVPNMYFNTTTEFYSLSDKIYKFNDGASKGKYLGEDHLPMYIDKVFNIGQDIDKIYFNLNWISAVYNGNTQLFEKTLSHLTVTGIDQIMDRVALVPYTTFGAFSNCRRKKDTWNFNKIKTTNVDPFKRRPIVGKYAIVRYEFDNTPNLDNSQNSIYLYLLSSNFRKADV